jgi:hypothetical protein
MVAGLITDNDEAAYREQVRDVAVCCQHNNLSLNVSMTKELIMDNRNQRCEHGPIHINGAIVERVESFKFLCVHITKQLTWSTHTHAVVKRAQQHLFPLRLKRFGTGPQILRKLYRCTTESILTGCITAWYGNC